MIWPRSPNGVVPSRVARNEGSTGDRQKWEKGKEEYLATLRAKSDLSPVERKRYKALQQMSYPDFVKRYFAPLPQETLEARGFASISVGHVGTIQIENGHAIVIEATTQNGVQKVPYKEWIADADRRGQLFWLSRLNNTSPEIRAAVAATAERYLGRPYDFWNFDLRDDSCFYCSKLAWLAITKATSIPPDGKPNGDRVFWFIAEAASLFAKSSIYRQLWKLHSPQKTMIRFKSTVRLLMLLPISSLVAQSTADRRSETY